jgi:hypothetical protein
VSIRVRGGEHAVIHPDIPVIDNVAYLLNDGALLHPGGSLYVPEEPVDVLALPAGAPWLKISEAIDYCVRWRRGWRYRFTRRCWPSRRCTTACFAG